MFQYDVDFEIEGLKNYTALVRFVIEALWMVCPLFLVMSKRISLF